MWQEHFLKKCYKQWRFEFLVIAAEAGMFYMMLPSVLLPFLYIRTLGTGRLSGFPKEGEISILGDSELHTRVINLCCKHIGKLED